MILEAIFVAYIVESARGLYYHVKEWRRCNRLDAHFSAIMRDSRTLEELAKNCTADKVNNPELYKKVPQTWMVRFINKTMID